MTIMTTLHIDRIPLKGYHIIKDTGERIDDGFASFGSRWDLTKNIYFGHRAKPTDLKANKTPVDVHLWQEFDLMSLVYETPTSTYVDPAGRAIRPRPKHYLGLTEPLDWRLDGKLRLQIKDMTVNLAQDFAEYSQTCGLFSSLAKDIYGTFHSLRRGRGFEDFVRSLQAPRTKWEQRIANTWLGYQFGLRPLIQDIYSLVSDDLSLINPSRYRERTITARENYFRQFSDKVDILYPPGHVIQEEYQKWNFKQTVVFRVIPGDLHWLASFGFLNPAELAWELLPWSFVIDWMFNVGDVLSGLDALVGVTLVSNQSSFKSTQKCWTSLGNSYEENWSHRSEQRTSLGYGRIRYEPSKSLKSVLSGLALLTQLRR